MGRGTENAPAPDGGLTPYSCWEIDVRMFNQSNQQIDAFTCRQDLWITNEQFVVRLTRSDGSSQYEDRGAVGQQGIKGNSGFGGKLTGQLMKNNATFLEGKGGRADFVLVATQTGPTHYRCFRRFDVNEPGSLWGTRVSPGTYYITTEDQLVETSDEPPTELRTPLKQAS